MNPSEHLFSPRFLLKTLLPLLALNLNPEFPRREAHAGSERIPQETREKAPLILAQGEQRLLRIADLERFSVGSGALRAHSRPGSLLLKGVHPGQGDLWVWKKDGTDEHRSIRVEKSPPEFLKPVLERALSRLEEVEVLLSGNGITLRGEITSLNESARVEALVRGFAPEVHDETELAGPLLEEGHQRLLRWLKSSPALSKLRLDRQDRSLLLVGSLERESDRDALTRRARAIFPPVRLDLSSLPDDSPTVHFKVFLLELLRNRFRSFGLGWPASQAAAFRVTTGAIQDLLQLDLMLKALEGEGAGKILSNPELVVRAPGEAELFSGGELPIRMQSHFYSNVNWKTFGLTLKLKVTHSTADRVRLDIFSEVSHLDSALADDKVPGLEVNRMRTQVDARYGTPLFLSGLLQQKLHKEARGLPLLGQIPVLGALFSSEDYQHERSELVAILLPSATPPQAPVDRVNSLPRGPLPAPRDWVSPKEEIELRKSSDFPWNALERPEKIETETP